MSKKDVSALVKGMGVAMAIITNLAQKAKAKGLTDEDLHRLATPEGDPLLDRFVKIMVEDRDGAASPEYALHGYTVYVNCRMTLHAMILAGHYAWVDDKITVQNFPQNKAGDSREIEIRLFHLGFNASGKQVFHAMDKAGYRPAMLSELLALGVTQPELQRKFPIMALGSYWGGPDGRVYIPVLSVSGDRRSLDLDWGDPSWLWQKNFRFAAVRK